MKEAYMQDLSLAGVENDQNFNFKCKYCLRNLSSRQNLKEHMYIHTGEKPYVCTEVGCGQSFRQGSLLSIHKKVHVELKRDKEAIKKTYKKCLYPKLTDLLLVNDSSVHSTLEDSEKYEWINRIGQQNFKFAEQYIRRT